MSDLRRDFEGRGKDWTAPLVSRDGRPIGGGAGRMAWSAVRPTEPGWYWVRGRAGNWAEHGVIVRVEIYPKLHDPVVIVRGSSFPPIPPDAEWAGPILEPVG